MRYAIQSKNNGQVIDYCDIKEQAEYWLKNHPVELVDTTISSKLTVIYTELGGPYGYGHQEDSFTTYGGLKHCIANLCKWMQSTARTFGPDAREVKDFFRHCKLYINDQDRSSWLLSQIDKINIKTIYA